MTSFAAQTPDPFSTSRDAVESIVRRTRQKAAPAAVEMRREPRLSIAELNAMDLDTLRERFASTRRDDRGPVERFLDAIDAPRNQLFAALAPGLERRARERGDKGAFGTGRVHFSDVLGELGMSPGFARGAVGLVGDIAFDPLTWIGPAGWGAKATTAGGRAVHVSQAGVRAVKAAEKGRIADDAVRGLVDAAGGTSQLRRNVFGAPTAGRTVVGRAAQKVGRFIGGAQASEGGLLAKYADEIATVGDAPDVAAKIKAANDFLARYGKGTGPGVRIGRDAGGRLRVSVGGRGARGITGATSQIAHVPFTDIGIYVPAFTAEAAAAARTLAWAGNTPERLGVKGPATSPRVEAIRSARFESERAASAIEKLNEEEAAFRAANADAIGRLSVRGAPESAREYPLLADAGADPDEAVATVLAGFRARREQLAEALTQRLNDVTALRTQIESAPGRFTSGEIIALDREARAFAKTAQAAMDRYDAIMPTVKLRSALLGEEAARNERVTAVLRSLERLDQTEKGSTGRSGYHARPFLGINPATGETAVVGDLGVIGDVSELVRPLLDEYDEALNELASAESIGGLTREQRVGGASAAELRSRVESLRDRILEASAPLRASPDSTPDAVAEAVRARDRLQLSEANQRIIAIADDEARLTESTADAIHKSMQASLEAAIATRNSAVAFMTPEQRRLLGLQKMILGTDDAIVGAASMVPLRAVTETLFGNDPGAIMALREGAAATARRRFGQSGGRVDDLSRYVAYMAGDGARRRAYETIAQARREIGDIARKHGLTHKEPELLALATALGYRLRQNEIGRPVVHGTAFGTKEAAGFEFVLSDAVKSGMLDESLHPGLAKELEAFAAARLGRFDEIGKQEIASGVLGPGSVRPGYIPNAASFGARELIRKNRDTGPDWGSQAIRSARAAGLEEFEQARATDSARFTSRRLGEEVEVFEGDRWAQGLSDADIEAIRNPEVRAEIRRLKDLLDEYDAMPDRPPMLGNDPFTINQLVKEGRFNTLIGTNDPPGGFFDTNLATILASRVGAHERAMARELFRTEVMAANALPVEPGKIADAAQMPVGTPIDLGNGLVGKIVRLGPGVPAGVQIGDDIFRPFKREVRTGTENPLIAAIGDRSIGEVYHVRVAEAIERAAELFNPEREHAFWRAIEQVTGTWKTITLFHPSWWIGNVIGESINFTTQDAGFPAAMVKHGRNVAAMFRHLNDPARLREIKFDIGGSAATGEDVADLVRDTAAVNASLFGEPAARSVNSGGFVLPSRLGGARESASFGALKADVEQAFEHAATATGKRGAVNRAKAIGSVASDRVNRYLKEPWFRVNTMTSDMLRTIAYLSLRDQGSDHAAAMARMVRGGFDYQNLSEFERTRLRRLIPFYTWIKNNSIYQAKLLMERPIYAGSYPLIQNAIEEAVNGEERVPTHARPQWMREQLAVQFGSGQSRTGLLIGNYLPQEGAFFLGRAIPGIGDVNEAARYVGSALNPLVRLPIEMAAGKEIFSDRTIGGDPLTSDITPAGHLLGQIRPLRDAPKLVDAFARQGVAAGVGRALLGGRLQPMDDDRVRMSRLREFKQEEERLRRSVRRAEYAGDTAASVASRARLLRLYQDMDRAGLGDEVPKWAAEQLAALAG